MRVLKATIGFIGSMFIIAANFETINQALTGETTSMTMAMNLVVQILLLLVPIEHFIGRIDSDEA